MKPRLPEWICALHQSLRLQAIRFYVHVTLSPKTATETMQVTQASKSGLFASNGETGTMSMSSGSSLLTSSLLRKPACEFLKFARPGAKLISQLLQGSPIRFNFPPLNPKLQPRYSPVKLSACGAVWIYLDFEHLL